MAKRIKTNREISIQFLEVLIPEDEFEGCVDDAEPEV